MTSTDLDRHRQALRTAAEGAWSHDVIARRCRAAGEPAVAVRAIMIRLEWEAALDLAVAEYLHALVAS